MDIPRTERSESGEINMYAAGRCSCGMAKMSIGGVQKCPKCDTKSTTRSGKVNKIKSVPDSAFKTVKRKASDGSTYEEKVLKTKIEIAKEIKMGKAEIVTGSLIDSGAALNLKQAIEDPKTIAISPLEFLYHIENFFDSAPAKSLTEFKRVDKLRKAIKKLRTQIEDYMGGK